jgi:hypothetical protein
MIVGRQEILSQADKNRANPKVSEKSEKSEKPEKFDKFDKNERKKRNEEKKAKANEKKQTYGDVRSETRMTEEELAAKKTNKQFEEYYQGMGLLSEEEWPIFYQ